MALTFQDITHPADLTLDLNHLERLLSGEESSYTMEKRYVTKQGRLVWVLLAVSLVRDDAGEPSHFISQIKDITETREMEERLRELANHDPVTDLLNRRRFEDELVRQVGRCRRYGETACLLILDVDDFKGVNDALGHRIGRCRAAPGGHDPEGAPAGDRRRGPRGRRRVRRAADRRGRRRCVRAGRAGPRRHRGGDDRVRRARAPA